MKIFNKTTLFSFFILLFTSLSAQAIQSCRYDISFNDDNASMLLARWAAMDGRIVIWNNEDVYYISNPEKLNKELHLSDATSYDEAWNRIQTYLNNHRRPEQAPLKSCYYKKGDVAFKVFMKDDNISTNHC